MTQNMFGGRKATLTSSPSQAFTNSARRSNLYSQASWLALRSAIGIAAAAGASLLAPGQAWAACTVGGLTVQCDNTSTTDTTYPANSPDDRAYPGSSGTPTTLTI